jgi:hypothetical protein
MIAAAVAVGTLFWFLALRVWYETGTDVGTAIQHAMADQKERDEWRNDPGVIDPHRSCETVWRNVMRHTTALWTCPHGSLFAGDSQWSSARIVERKADR